MKKPIYQPSKRTHNPSWLIHHSHDLLKKALRLEDSSKILYACLELRNCLEMVEFRLILASLEEHERSEVIALAKPHHGIEKTNKKVKTLNAKFQSFYKMVCEVYGIKGNAFDFCKSSELKNDLSEYIHIYTRTESELAYGSAFLNAAIPLIASAIGFLEHALNKGDGVYKLQNISITTLSDDDQQILQRWKEGKIKDETDLKEILLKQKEKTGL